MILGINTSHDTCFCLLNHEGQPAYVLEEERFNRIKHSGFSTTISLELLLRDGLLDPASVTDLVYSFEMEAGPIAKLMEKCYENVIQSFGTEVFQKVTEYFHQPEHLFLPTKGLGLTTQFHEVMAKLRNMFPNAREVSYMHHLCHAASAFYPSPFDSAAVIIVDGSGRLETTTIWHATTQEIKLLHQIELPHSIGILYWLFSHYLSLEEGQTMGLAAYGEPIYKELIYDRIIAVDERGNFEFKAPIVFWFDMDSEYAVRIIEDMLDAKARYSQEEPLTQFHANVAASIQCVTEEILLKIATQAQQLTREENLCLAGGVIQNCVANGRLLQEKIFQKVWIQPMANDAGTALGAALYHYYQTNPVQKSIRWRMTSPQLGVGYCSQKIETYLKLLNIPLKRSVAPAQEVAQWLATGYVIGWFQGKGEVGPRALGGRSILADPRYKFTPFTVNEIKQRQPWRPLAPSIIEEHASEYVALNGSSPFMILSFPILPQMRSKIPAVCHVDGSARIQTVSQENYELYHDLISCFYSLTGIPVILNTSFNRRGEPIVQHPLEAIRDFILTGIDRIILEDYVIENRPLSNPLLKEALASSSFIALYEHYLRQFKQVIFIEHGELLDKPLQQKVYLQAILNWLQISYIAIPPAEFEVTISSMLNQRLNLVSITPCLDEQVLRRMPHHLLQDMIVSVVDYKMFMSQVSAPDFLEIIDRNRQEFHHLVNMREVVLWAQNDEIHNILQDLRLLGVDVVGIISTEKNNQEVFEQNLKIFAPEFLADKLQAIFLVTSFSIMDQLKSQLRQLGYHSGVGYLVWDTQG